MLSCVSLNALLTEQLLALDAVLLELGIGVLSANKGVVILASDVLSLEVLQILVAVQITLLFLHKLYEETYEFRKYSYSMALKGRPN